MTKHGHEKLTQELLNIRVHCKNASSAIYAGRGYDALSPNEQGLVDEVVTIHRSALEIKLKAEEIEKEEQGE